MSDLAGGDATCLIWQEATHGQLVLSQHSAQLLLVDGHTYERYQIMGKELDSGQFLLTKVVRVACVHASV